MSIPSYRQEQEEFLESIMDMLTLSGYKPKTYFEDGDPVLTIKLKEMNGQKLRIYANPENLASFGFSKKLDIRYAKLQDKYGSFKQFTGDLDMVEGWTTLVNVEEFCEHQREGGLMDGLVEEQIEEPSLMEKLVARRAENLPGGFVMMSNAEVMASRRSAYNFAF